jgi:hypothetical protein
MEQALALRDLAGSSGTFEIRPLEELFGTLEVSERSVEVEKQKTASRFAEFLQAMEAQFQAIAAENRSLSGLLIAADGRSREGALVHQHEVASLQQVVQEVREEARLTREQAVAADRRAEERSVADAAACMQAVQASALASDARVTAVQEELQQARQAMEAQRVDTERQLAAARVEKDVALQEERTRAKAAQQELMGQIAGLKQELGVAKGALQRESDRALRRHEMLCTIRKDVFVDEVVRGMFPGKFSMLDSFIKNN